MPLNQLPTDSGGSANPLGDLRVNQTDVGALRYGNFHHLRRGTFVVTQNTHPDWASDPSGKPSATDQQAVNDLRDEIQRILIKTATESDSTTAMALRLMVGQSKCVISNARYESQDSTAKVIADAHSIARKVADKAACTAEADLPAKVPSV